MLQKGEHPLSKRYKNAAVMQALAQVLASTIYSTARWSKVTDQRHVDVAKFGKELHEARRLWQKAKVHYGY